MTPLTKKVERATDITHDGRPVSVALEPGDVLAFQEKGRKNGNGRRTIALCDVFATICTHAPVQAPTQLEGATGDAVRHLERLINIAPTEDPGTGQEWLTHHEKQRLSAFMREMREQLTAEK